MKKLNREDMEVILRLKTQEDFILFLGILKESTHLLGIANGLLRDEIDVRWNQGKMQELLDIIKKINDTDTDLEYMRKQAKRQNALAV